MWENGHSTPTPREQRRLAELYGVTLAELLPAAAAPDMLREMDG
jgi:transcriptional regulator with XRE-family HTH domain